METNRREFLSTVVRGTVCAVCMAGIPPMISSCENPAENAADQSIPLIEGEPIIDLSTETGLQNAGGSVKKRFSAINGGSTVIIYRVSASAFTAFAAQCTHQGTEIGLPANAVMICPNHGSKFNANNGAVIQGPAAASLTKFSVIYDSGKNTIMLL